MAEPFHAELVAVGDVEEVAVHRFEREGERAVGGGGDAVGGHDDDSGLRLGAGDDGEGVEEAGRAEVWRGDDDAFREFECGGPAWEGI